MLQRIIVALILIPIVIKIIFSGGWWYRGFVSFALATGLFEFIYSHKKRIGIINKLLAIIALLILVNIDLDYSANITLFAAMILIIITANFLLLPPTDFYDKIKIIIFAIVYLSVLGLHFNLLRFKPFGNLESEKIVLFVLAFSWVCDSGAYFVGKSIGKRKLAPVLSPNKTIEGLIGGTIFSIIFAVLYKYFYFQKIGYLDIVLLAIFLSAICPLGDLCASAIKRATNIKNYSQLLPGHGGIIDRLDSLLYTVTFTVFYFNIKSFLFNQF